MLTVSQTDVYVYFLVYFLFLLNVKVFLLKNLVQVEKKNEEKKSKELKLL